MTYFIVIIGGGPNGIYAYNQCRNLFSDKNILLIEKNEIINSIKSYPNILWHSPFHELCFDGENNTNKSHPMGNDVIQYYEKYCKNNNISFLKEKVINIEKENENYKIITNNSNIQCKYVILCTGIYENKNRLDINTNYSYISYDYCDFSLRNKHLVLIGGGNSSIDYIINLLPYNKITWIIRANSHTTNSAHLNLLRNTIHKYKHNLYYYNNSNVSHFYENNSLKLSNGKIIDNIDFCNILIGFNSKNDLLTNIGIQYDQYNNIKMNDNYETNLKNLFIFGSLASTKNDIVYIHNGNPKRLSKITNYIQNNINS